MSNKDTIYDIINWLAILGLIVFFVYYLVLGDRGELVKEIMQSTLPLTFFVVVFLLKFRFKQKEARVLKKENSLGRIFANLSLSDKRNDLILAVLFPLAIYIIGLAEKASRGEENLQALIIFGVLLLWHFYIFAGGREETRFSITFFKKIYDEIIIYSLPVTIFIVAMASGQAGLIDTVQAVTIFLLMYTWRKILYRNKN